MKIKRLRPGGWKQGLHYNLNPFEKALEKIGVKDTDSITEYDILHIHNPQRIDWKKVKQKPTIITFHGSITSIAKHFYIGNMKQNLAYVLRGLKAIWKCDGVIFTNLDDYFFFKDYKARCIRIPTGYDPKTFYKTNYGKRAGSIAVGRHNAMKRPMMHVKLADKLDDQTLTSIIEGMTQKELRQAYNEHKYVLNTGLQEGFNKTITEGIACGCIPIVRGAMETNMKYFNLNDHEWDNVAQITKAFYEVILNDHKYRHRN